VMYDRAGHHSEGISGITGNVRAISTAASLKALFPEENPGLLDWRKYDHEDLDPKETRLVVVFADMGGFLGFYPSAFTARIRKYMENGGKVIWVSEGNAGLVPGMRSCWKMAPTKRVYAHSTFPVEEKLVPTSKVAWEMTGKRELSFLRPTFCNAGWTWAHARGYCEAASLPADVRPVTRFVAPDGRSFVQGVVWPKADPQIAVLPPYALFGWIFWRQPASGRIVWPCEMPEFAGTKAECAYETPHSSFASFIASSTPNEVLCEAHAAYISAGWREEPIRASDMLVFTKGTKVAAVLARPHKDGSLVSAIIRTGGK